MFRAQKRLLKDEPLSRQLRLLQRKVLFAVGAHYKYEGLRLPKLSFNRKHD